MNRALGEDWKRFCKEPRLLARLAALEIPALFVIASNDIRPSWPAEQLAALLPNGRCEWIDGAGHVIWLTHADELRATLRAFLLSLDQPVD